MPTDLAHIPTAELLQDLVDTIEDIQVCQTAKQIGVETYGKGKSVAERLRVNLAIKQKIEAELHVRQVPVQVVVL